MKNFIRIFSIGVTFLLGSCLSNNENQIEKPRFKTITPLLKDTSYTKDYVAEINAFQNVEIRSRVGGFIESLHVDEGQTVHKGQVLFTINSRRFSQQLQKTKAATKSIQAKLSAAEIELSGSKKLLLKDYISETEYALTVAKIKGLKAELEEAKIVEAEAELNLSFAKVKAPFNGVINRIPYKEGSVINEGALLTIISNTKDVFAYFNVSEVDYLSHVNSTLSEENREVQLVLADGSLYPHKGFIETIESEFDTNTGTIAFRAKFANPDNILKHGASGKIQLLQKVNKALLIPQKVTFERQEDLYVYVVDKDNRLQPRKISTIFNLPHFIAVKEGLSIDDKILYEGIQYVEEGEKILTQHIQYSEISPLKIK